MEQIPQIVRQRMQSAPKPEVHPDPDVLTALAEKALNERERDQVLQHLAVCADCREVLSLAQPQFEIEIAAVAAAGEPDRARSWLQGSWLRWGAAAACMVVVSAAVLLRYQSRKLTSYSPSTQPASLGVARQAPAESHPLYEMAPSSDEADKLAELKQDSRRGRAAMDVQAANELAVKQQAARDLGKLSAGQKKESVPRIKGEVAGGMLGGARAKGALAGTAGAAPAAPPLDAKVVGGALTRDEARQDAPPAPASTETIEVTIAPAVQTGQSAPVSTAQNVAPALSAEQSRTASRGEVMTDNATVTVEAQGEVALRKAATSVTPRWTLSSDGSTLMRSVDAGKTWQTVPVAGNVVFRAVSAVGPEVWVGGSAGALYHSSDVGKHWVPVRPLADGQTLTADIVRIEFTDAMHGKLTTANRQVWTTNDAGHSWQKQ